MSPPRQVTGTLTQGPGAPGTPWYVRVVDAVGTALDVALEATLQQVRDRFAAAGALPGASFPSTTRIGSVLIARDENTLAPALAACTSSGALRTSTNLSSFTATSRTTGGVYEEQRGITYGCALGSIEVFVDPTAAVIGAVGGRNIAGYVLLVNTASPATGASTPHGGHVYPVVPGEKLEISRNYAEPFTSGLRAVLSTTPNIVTLGGPRGLFTVKALSS